ncbi:hypothetical protein PTSG_12058 [Salpingoeca rosetta]|uniref:Spt20-like SEP domain-containing protein n=2 Tax=Salpingoeca rosetta (strain ATCC 50818 / BSB-021) TaxID=946362 RepID=F2U6A2_SALR5|nr:uncharacterized protein PTSG_12058 [Salpingoeca rosetta]EGD83044.1 hypothetical protein PTSG_12058 [Salpingoeca rosetta]|eukprot:XP_004995408.1 hypothetical protein PTSG_12058 [Salpingoeca rosetta]
MRQGESNKPTVAGRSVVANMLRSLKEVERELSPGFLLFLHDDGWAFSAVATFSEEDALPALLPFDRASRLLFKDIDAGRLSHMLRDIVGQSQCPIVDGCVMVEVRDYRVAFLDYSQIDTSGDILPSIRRHVLRPTTEVMLADILEMHRAANPDAAPPSNDTVIALERALLQHMKPEVELKPSTSVFRAKAAQYYDQNMYSIFGKSRLRFSRKILRAHLLAAKQAGGKGAAADKHQPIVDFLRKHRPATIGHMAKRALARARVSEVHVPHISLRTGSAELGPGGGQQQHILPDALSTSEDHSSKQSPPPSSSSFLSDLLSRSSSPPPTGEASASTALHPHTSTPNSRPTTTTTTATTTTAKRTSDNSTAPAANGSGDDGEQVSDTEESEKRAQSPDVEDSTSGAAAKDGSVYTGQDDADVVAYPGNFLRYRLLLPPDVPVSPPNSTKHGASEHRTLVGGDDDDSEDDGDNDGDDVNDDDGDDGDGQYDSILGGRRLRLYPQRSDSGHFPDPAPVPKAHASYERIMASAPGCVRSIRLKPPQESPHVPVPSARHQLLELKPSAEGWTICNRQWSDLPFSKDKCTVIATWREAILHLTSLQQWLTTNFGFIVVEDQQARYTSHCVVPIPTTTVPPVPERQCSLGPRPSSPYSSTAGPFRSLPPPSAPHAGTTAHPQATATATTTATTTTSAPGTGPGASATTGATAGGKTGAMMTTMATTHARTAAPLSATAPPPTRVVTARGAPVMASTATTASSQQPLQQQQQATYHPQGGATGAYATTTTTAAPTMAANASAAPGRAPSSSTATSATPAMTGTTTSASYTYQAQQRGPSQQYTRTAPSPYHPRPQQTTTAGANTRTSTPMGAPTPYSRPPPAGPVYAQPTPATPMAARSSTAVAASTTTTISAPTGSTPAPASGHCGVPTCTMCVPAQQPRYAVPTATHPPPTTMASVPTASAASSVPTTPAPGIAPQTSQPAPAPAAATATATSAKRRASVAHAYAVVGSAGDNVHLAKRRAYSTSNVAQSDNPYYQAANNTPRTFEVPAGGMYHVVPINAKTVISGPPAAYAYATATRTAAPAPAAANANSNSTGSMRVAGVPAGGMVVQTMPPMQQGTGGVLSMAPSTMASRQPVPTPQATTAAPTAGTATSNVAHVSAPPGHQQQQQGPTAMAAASMTNGARAPLPTSSQATVVTAATAPRASTPAATAHHVSGSSVAPAASVKRAAPRRATPITTTTSIATMMLMKTAMPPMSSSSSSAASSMPTRQAGLGTQQQQQQQPPPQQQQQQQQPNRVVTTAAPIPTTAAGTTAATAAATTTAPSASVVPAAPTSSTAGGPTTAVTTHAPTPATTTAAHPTKQPSTSGTTTTTTTTTTTSETAAATAGSTPAPASSSQQQSQQQP